MVWDRQDGLPRWDGAGWHCCRSTTLDSLIIINMLINKLRYAAHHTTKFLNRSFGTAVKYARMFDQGMDTIGRIAKAVSPTIDQYAGTTTARHAKQINDA